MKNLVLSALVAAAVSQAAGCIIIADDNEPLDNKISAIWNYKRVGVTQPSCPAGADGVRLMVQSLPSQAEYVSQFGCNQPVLTDYFPNGRYRIWTELTLGNQAYAQSLAVEMDIFDEDVDLTFDIHEDRGYLLSSWSLIGASSGSSLSCAQVPTLANIALDATRQGTSLLTSSLMACPPGSGFSVAMDAATYTGAYSAVNAAQARISSTVERTNLQVRDRNQVTTAGSVVIPITGM